MFTVINYYLKLFYFGDVIALRIYLSKVTVLE